MITALQTQPLASSALCVTVHEQPASGLADTLRRWWQALAPLLANQTAPISFETLEASSGPVPDWQIPAYVRKARSGDNAVQWVSKRH